MIKAINKIFSGRKSSKNVAVGWKGASDSNLSDWATQPIRINRLLRTNLKILRARSQDLARNDDTAIRFLSLMEQNVIGHQGIKLQVKTKTKAGKLDKRWNLEVESSWKDFIEVHRYTGLSESPSACGQIDLQALAWQELYNRIVDGETFTQILRGYPHNKWRFAIRFLSPDLLDSSFNTILSNGNRIEMGIEFDVYDRPIAYHFFKEPQNGSIIQTSAERVRIPANQIIHRFDRTFVGQIRGIPAFAAILHKAKMLGGVHEAIVVGWRVAASKMGFFKASDGDVEFDSGEYDEFDESVIEAEPGSFEKLPKGVGLEMFDPEYPSSTYESGFKTFMKQIANGLNISSPVLGNDYEGVNYSSLRAATLEDREGYRCQQVKIIKGWVNPVFEEWYRWSSEVTRQISISDSRRSLFPRVLWRPRGFHWVDPQKEVNAKILEIENGFRTRQDVIAETTGEDFEDVLDNLAEEKEMIEERGLTELLHSDTHNIEPDEQSKNE